MNTLLIGIASLAIVAAPLVASAEPHGRDGGGYGGGYGGGDGDGDGGGYGGGGYGGYVGGDGDGLGAIAAGVAGLFLGSALANSGEDDYAPAYGYGYVQPAYVPRCFLQAQPYRTYDGGVAYQQVRVCR